MKVSKKEQLTKNEKTYGKEIREKYGNKKVEHSNKNFMKLSEEDFQNMQATESQLFQLLSEVVKTKNLDSQSAKSVYKNHKDWLAFSWKSDTPEAHIGLAEMYVSDQRFSDYYNVKVGAEATTTLRDIIVKYAK